MSIAPYPLGIRTILQAQKRRNQPAAFSLSSPRRGFAYTQETGTDVPAFWDVAFRFTAREALIFQLWFTQTIRRGVDEFTMPIKTEFGLITHQCRFLPDGLLPVSQEAETWSYTASIMARAQIIPADYLAAADLIVGLDPWESWASILDEAVTREMRAA